MVSTLLKHLYQYVCVIIAIGQVERLVWTNKVVSILDDILVTMVTARISNVYPR